MNIYELFKNRGYTYEPLTGLILGIRGYIKGHDASGYVVVSFRFNKKRYSIKGHKLAWYLYYNEIPTNLDHINRIKDDNRICNLRKATVSENGFNRNAKGYYFNKRCNKYRSSIMLNNKSIHLGYFNTEEEARNAYLEAKKKYHIFKND